MFLAGLKDVDTEAITSAIQEVLDGKKKKKYQFVEDDDALDPDDESSCEV